MVHCTDPVWTGKEVYPGGRITERERRRYDERYQGNRHPNEDKRSFRGDKMDGELKRFE